MKNISKKIFAVVVMIILLATVAGIEVKAADNSVVMSLSTNDKLVAGSTITINVDFKKSNEAGIGSVLGTLNYDENVLEYVSTTAKSDWNVNYVASTKKLGVERNNKTTTTGTIATMTFKVKDNITATSTTISYNIYDISVGENVSINTSATLSTDKSTSTDGTYTPTTPATSSNKNTSVNTTKNTSKNTIQSSKTTAKRILNAGDATTMAIVAVVAVVTIVGCLGFIKYSKNKDIK